MRPWKKIESISELDHISHLSESFPILLVKHSNICPVSDAAIKKIENHDELWSKLEYIYLIVVQEQRPISNLIASRWNVTHESPQAILLHHDQVLYHDSHLIINPEFITSLIV